MAKLQKKAIRDVNISENFCTFAHKYQKVQEI